MSEEKPVSLPDPAAPEEEEEKEEKKQEVKAETMLAATRSKNLRDGSAVQVRVVRSSETLCYSDES